MSKSKIYKELNLDQLNRISKDLYGNNTTIFEHKILKGGLFNTTYFIKTNKDENGIVVRVAPVNQHLLLDFEKDMMSAEPLFHNMLIENNIPTTKIIKYSQSNTVIDRGYIVSEYMDSIPMNDKSLDGVDLSYIYEHVGELIYKIHNITNDKFGWLRNGECKFERWSDFIIAFSNELADKAIKYNLFDKSTINSFSDIFNNNINILDEIAVPQMVHTDIWPGNILLKKTKNNYEVAAIIDLDRTIFGDKYMDLSSPWMINDNFLIGYNEKLPTTENYNKRKYLYKLLLGFLETYVWLVQYDNIENFENHKKDSINLINTIIS